MLLAPRPGLKYRDTLTKRLIDPAGEDLDESNLDVVRAMACGDLVTAEQLADLQAQAAPDPAEPTSPKKAPAAGAKE